MQLQLTLPHIRRVFSHYCESSRSAFSEEGHVHVTEKKFISLPGFLRFTADCQIAQLCERAELINLFRIVNEFHIADVEITSMARTMAMSTNNQNLTKDAASGRSSAFSQIPEGVEEETAAAGALDDSEANDADTADLPAEVIENPEDELIESEFVQALLMLASMLYDVDDVTLAEKFFMLMVRLICTL